ncbi:uncharacterized protein TNCV_3598711 [Trichonephila clavipes]|nr:uncharacterized protein TNCV_3598711 [Trichonephila clavipes]
MTRYTNQEMTDIHFIYSVADRNALEAGLLYGERFPSRHLPNRKTFEHLHRRLRETGSFVCGMHVTRLGQECEDTGIRRACVACEFEEQPETSMRTLSTAANVSHMTVWRVLGALRAYNAQCVHALKAIDHESRVDFSRWFLQRLAVQPDFAAHVLFPDKCSFSREGIFNAHNAHNWTYTYPHAIHTH